MKFDLRKAMSTSKGRLRLAVALLSAVWCVLLILYAKNLRELIPDDNSLRNVEQAIRTQQTLHDKVLHSYDEMNLLEARCRRYRKGAWNEARDGAVETDLRRRISDVAAKIEFPLNSLGSVHTSRINQDFFLAELDLSSSDISYEKAVKFVAALEELPFTIYWKRLDLRPEMRSRNTNNNVSVVSAVAARSNAAATPAVSSTQINFSANLRVLCCGSDTPAKPEGGK